MFHSLVYWLAMSNPAIHVYSAIVDDDVCYVFWKLSCYIHNQFGCLTSVFLDPVARNRGSHHFQ